MSLRSLVRQVEDAGGANKTRRAVAQLELGDWSSTKSIGEGVRECIIDFGRDGTSLVILTMTGAMLYLFLPAVFTGRVTKWLGSYGLK